MRSKAIILPVLCAFLLILVSCSSKVSAWQEQYDLGVRYLEEGNYEEAIIAFTTAIEIDPKQAPAYVGRGDAYIGSGETEENLAAAQADYEMAIELDETNAQAYLGLADVYIRRGEYDKALEILRNALDKTGNHQTIVDKIEEMESGSITDSSGKTRQESTYDGNGVLLYVHIYDYDKLGRQSAVTSYSSAGDQSGHVEKRYDTAGNRLNDYYWGDDGIVRRMDNGYDSAGNIVKQTYYSLEGDIKDYSIFQYDEDGRETHEDQYSGTGELLVSYILEYDFDGQRVKKSHYGPDGIVHGYYLTEYDAAGHRIKDSSYSENGALNWFWVYRYDDQGDYLGFEKYDAEGNLIQSTVVDK